MLNKKRNKLFIPAGLISLFLLFPLCYWHIQKEVLKNNQYILEATSLESHPDFATDTTRLFLAIPPRNYTTLQLTENQIQNRKILLEFCQHILNFDWKKDTLNGIQISLDNLTAHNDFVAVFEIIHSTQMKHYIHQENSFWLFVPNSRDFSDFQQRIQNFKQENEDVVYLVCGYGSFDHFFDTTYQKHSFLDKLLLVYQNITNSTLPTKYWIFILILVVWNVFQLIRISKIKT